jgi:hypothetical protein
VKILGFGLVLLGVLAIVYNKQNGKLYADFQKGWGLEGRTAVLVGRLIAFLGGLMFVVVGLLIAFS